MSYAPVELPDVSTPAPTETQGWGCRKKVFSCDDDGQQVVGVFRWYEHTAFPDVCGWYLQESYAASSRPWHPAFGAVVATGTH